MKLYFPIYDRGWKIGTVDSDLLHFYGIAIMAVMIHMIARKL